MFSLCWIDEQYTQGKREREREELERERVQAEKELAIAIRRRVGPAFAVPDSQFAVPSSQLTWCLVLSSS